MPAQAIIDNKDSCMDPTEIAEAFEVDVWLVKAIVAFAEEYRAEAQARVVSSPEFAALLDAVPAPRPLIGADARRWSGWTGPFHDTWVLRGTPTPADMLMAHFDDGMPLEDIAEHYGWDEALIAALIDYGEA